MISPSGFTAGMSVLALTILQSETIRHRINFILPGRSGKFGEKLVIVAAIVSSVVASVFLDKYFAFMLLSYNFICIKVMDRSFEEKFKLIPLLNILMMSRTVNG